MSIALFPITILLIVTLVIPFSIGVYVYRDAKCRGMNVALWTIISIFAPALIGFIIYLLVRGNYSNLKCSACGNTVKDEYVVCPACGAKLRPVCPKCQAPVEPGWIVCPRCAEQLPQNPEDIVPPNRPKDKTLVKILLCLIVVPVILIILMYLLLGANFSAGAASYQEIAVQEYFDMQESQEISEEVIDWRDNCDLQSHRAYALRYTKDSGNSNGHYFLVYVPGASNHNEHKFGQSSGLFGTTIKLELNYTGNSGTFFFISSTSDRVPKLQIKLDGDKIPCEVTSVDYNPTLYSITPEYDISDAPEGAVTVEAYVEQITEDPEMKADQLFVTKYTDTQEIGTVEFLDQDDISDMIKIIDSFDYLIETPAFLENYTLADFYLITIHYADTTGPAYYEDTSYYYAIEQGGEYYLLESSSEYLADQDDISEQLPDNDNFLVMKIDEDFYGMLSALTEE